MKKTEYHPDSDLWKGEQLILAEFLQCVPDGGTVVEIGTFKGGTAVIMSEMLSEKMAKIYAVDIAPDPKAYENLRNTHVELIVAPSDHTAEEWSKRNIPIDLLFIDGCHKFESVFSDYRAWHSHMKEGGTVMFHDYDPVHRGGIAHLGVRVFIEGLIKCKSLKEVSHRFKLFAGKYFKDSGKTPDFKVFAEIFDNIKAKTETIDGLSAKEWQYAGDDLFYLLVSKLKPEIKYNTLAQTDATGRYMVPGNPDGLPFENLINKGIPQENLFMLDSVTSCLILEKLLRHDFSFVYGLSSNKAEFMRLSEMLDMYDYANTSEKEPENICELSKNIASMQVRLGILSRMLQTIVSWHP